MNRSLRKTNTRITDPPIAFTATAKREVEKALNGLSGNKKTVCHLFGMKIILKLERFGEWYNHLILQMETRKQLPGLREAEIILQEFGLSGTILEQDNVWLDVKSKRHPAIHILQQRINLTV